MVLALSEVETVGLWTGLLSAVVSTVLSVVAILFARDVDRRSMEISGATIRSLESIEATVQRLSDDTGGLIKVAWERMLGSMSPRSASADGDLEALLAGLLGELRADADELAPGSGVDKLVRDADRRLRRASKSGADRTTAPGSWAFNAAVQAIDTLSPTAIELLRALLQGGAHLTRSQYQELRRDPELAIALDELRDQDVLMPFQRRGKHGDETVYGLAPWFHDVLGPALVFTRHETPSMPEAQRVARALTEVGYRTNEMEVEAGVHP
ncbi:MAG: hypothetical protein QOJ19_4674 [Acidimicrobiia bacterium]|jgi:hypothetical protein|nr:hypothetical protein [Acidimicrobiia bacterium]